MVTNSVNYHYMQKNIVSNYIQKPAPQQNIFPKSYSFTKSSNTNSYQSTSKDKYPSMINSKKPVTSQLASNPIHQKKINSIVNQNMFGNPSTYQSSFQEKTINFGKDANENIFKKYLRNDNPFLLNTMTNNFSNSFNTREKSNQLQNSSRYSLDSQYLGKNQGKQQNNGFNNNFQASASSLIANSGRDYRAREGVNQNIFENKAKQSVEEDNFNFEENVKRPQFTMHKGIGYCEEPNLGFREGMEDCHKVIDCYLGDPNLTFLSLYDGHGGPEVAALCKDRVPEKLAGLMNEKRSNLESALVNTFEAVDKEIEKTGLFYCGTTAVVVVINMDPYTGQRVIYCANVGDSRGVLINKSKCIRLSYDHKGSDYSEANRIKSCGGMIMYDRVMGQLALTRAIGDFSFKKIGVVPTPYISRHAVSETDKYLVLASDGVWDVMEDYELLNISNTVQTPEDLSKLIVRISISRGTRDNTSCLCIKLN